MFTRARINNVSLKRTYKRTTNKTIMTQTDIHRACSFPYVLTHNGQPAKAIADDTDLHILVKRNVSHERHRINGGTWIQCDQVRHGTRCDERVW